MERKSLVGRKIQTKGGKARKIRKPSDIENEKERKRASGKEWKKEAKRGRKRERERAGQIEDRVSLKWRKKIKCRSQFHQHFIYSFQA